MEGVTAGIVVLHEGNGLTVQMLRLCERLAAEGYAVAAPDLFFRTGGPAAKEDYREQYGAVKMDEMLSDLRVAAGVLRSVGAQRLGVTGFCAGGRFTWHAARHGGGFDAAVSFYGTGIATDLGQTECPTLLFFGAHDPHVPKADVEKVAAAHPDTIVYPEAGHGFMRDGSDDYAAEAAADAWARMLAHFAQHLAMRA
jgi:carboxymethylenebutenolidase